MLIYFSVYKIGSPRTVQLTKRLGHFVTTVLVLFFHCTVCSCFLESPGFFSWKFQDLESFGKISLNIVNFFICSNGNRFFSAHFACRLLITLYFLFVVPVRYISWAMKRSWKIFHGGPGKS